MYFLNTIKNKIQEIFAYYKMNCGMWGLKLIDREYCGNRGFVTQLG